MGGFCKTNQNHARSIVRALIIRMLIVRLLTIRILTISILTIRIRFIVRMLNSIKRATIAQSQSRYPRCIDQNKPLKTRLNTLQNQGLLHG